MSLLMNEYKNQYNIIKNGCEFERPNKRD